MPVLNSIFAISLYEGWLSKNSKLCLRSIKAYVRVANQFEKTDPDKNDSQSYINFLIETAGKKRNYQNIYAMIWYIRYTFMENQTLRSHLIQKIKQVNIQQKETVKHIDKNPLSQKELINTIEKFEEYRHVVMSYIMYFTGLRIGGVLSIPLDGIFFESEGEYGEVLKVQCIEKGEKAATRWVWEPGAANLISKYVKYVKEIKKAKQNKKIMNDKNLIYYLFLENYVGYKDEPPHMLMDAQKTEYHYFYLALKTALNTSNINMNRFAPHSFRRMYAKQCWDKFHDIDILKRMLGHQDIATTYKYLQQQGLDIATASRRLQLDE